MGRNGSSARSAPLGVEACGAAGLKRAAADAACCTPQQPKRPRLEPSTSSTISTASTVDKEGAAAEEASVMEVEPPADDVNNAGGDVSNAVVNNAVNNALVAYADAPAPMAAGAEPHPGGGALVVHPGAPAPMAATPDSTPGATADATLNALTRRMSDLEQQVAAQQQHTNLLSQAVQCLWCPEKLVAEGNKAAVAIGVINARRGTGVKKGSGFCVAEVEGGRLVVDSHHVLLDCRQRLGVGTPTQVEVGVGENPIVWGLFKGEVLNYSPTPRAPGPYMPDHRAGKPRPWLDLALLYVPGLSSPCLRASRYAPAPGMEIAILGYGEQNASDALTTTFGVVACTRYDERIGCNVFDIQGDMLFGHSGGPVINRRDGGVMGVCISSQTEPARATIRGQPTNIRVPIAVGGLHTVIPIAELKSLLGVNLTA